MGQNQYDFIDYPDFCAQVAAVVGQKNEQGIINICSGKPEKLADRVERFIKENDYRIKLQYEERLSFVLFGILYASRCNNFHGNVAARMNSINANKDTFKMYTDMFLTEYIILAIHLNSQGALPDMVLNKVKENANLMV